MDDDPPPAATPDPGDPRGADASDRDEPAASRHDEPAGFDPAGVRPVDLRDYVSFSRGAATRVRVFATSHQALDLWCIEPQQSSPVLHHEGTHLTYTVLGGRSWFVTDEGEVGLDPMGSVLIPPGVVHGIDNRAPDPLIIVAVSSPPTPAPGAGGEDRPEDPRGDAIRREPDTPNVLRRVADRLLGGG